MALEALRISTPAGRTDSVYPMAAGTDGTADAVWLFMLVCPFFLEAYGGFLEHLRFLRADVSAQCRHHLCHFDLHYLFVHPGFLRCPCQRRMVQL